MSGMLKMLVHCMCVVAWLHSLFVYTRWDAQTGKLSILQQAALPPRDAALIADMRRELAELLAADGNGVSDVSMSSLH
jgi:hypothetical protein